MNDSRRNRCSLTGGLIATAALILAANAFGQAKLILSKPAGPPTLIIAVSGAGFAPNDSVDIFFDTSDIALAQADPSGSFSSISVQVPASAQPGKHFFTAVARGSGASTQTRFIVRSNWPQFGYWPRGKRSNPYENTLSPSNVGSLHLRWSFPTGAQPVENPPVVAYGLLYFESGDGTIYALDAATGAKRWSFATVDPVHLSFYAAPAVANGVVYAGTSDLYALNAFTGALLWSYPSAVLASSPVVTGGIVYIHSEPGRVLALDAASGAIVGQNFGFGPLLFAPLTVADGSLYTTFDGSVEAMQTDASPFPIRWTFSVQGSIVTTPIIALDVVYVTSWNGNTYALNAATGAQIWSYPTGSAFVLASQALADGVLYVDGGSGFMYALDAPTGAKLWQFLMAGGSNSSPAVANGVVYVGAFNGSHLDSGELYALDAKTGAELWSVAGGFADMNSPTVVNGMVYMGSLDGSLYAFGLPPGSLPIRAPNPSSLYPDYSLQISKPARPVPQPEDQE